MDNMTSKKFAFIPARGNSKRVKKKNLLEINGLPLFGYAVKTARESRLFDAILVNSEDDEVLDKARELGATPYRRPDILAGDKVFIIDVLKEMISSLEVQDQDVFGIMLPTCPLRTVEDITGAYEAFKQHGCRRPVVSVSSYSTPIQLAQFLAPDGCLDPAFPSDYKRSTRSTDHQTAYHYNEAIVFNNAGNLKKQTNLIGDRPLPFIMPPDRSFVLDYPYQAELLELLIKKVE